MKRNKFLSVFLALIMIISIIPMSTITASAATSGTCGENVYWDFDESTGTLTISGTGIMDNYSFVNSPWKSYEDNIKSIIISYGVTSIGASAFSDCYSLTCVTIPDSVTIIGDLAFDFCISLTNVIIPDSVIMIGYRAFSGCHSLTSITIPDSVISIGEGAFSSCEVTSFAVDNNNQYFSNDEYGVLFNKDKTTLIQYPIGNTRTSYIIPDSVLTIGYEAFHADNNLTNIKIGDNVTTISDRAFHNSFSLTSVTISDSVISIGDAAFGFCLSLTSITVDDNNQYFSNDEYGVLFNKDKTALVQYPICNTRTSYKIPDSVSTIGERAFYACENLNSVTIPGSVTSIDFDVFSKCMKLASITVDNNNQYYSNDEYGVLFNKDKTTLIQYPSGNTGTSYIIPDSVTTIGRLAFFGCKNLTDVYYSGTEEEWNAITIEEYNDSLFNVNIHFNYLEHTHNYTSVVTPPTCTERGYTTYTCECGDSYIGNYVDPSHTTKTITISATCTVAGMSYNVCEICGETLGDSTVIPAKGHTAGGWEIVFEPTYEADGKKVQKCTVCGEVVAEEVIPMLVKITVTDEDTNVSIEVDSDDYNGIVDIVVEESFDGTAFDVIDTSLNASQKFIYDITMTVDGVVTQPNGTVTVKIPLPNGYDPNRSFVYHVDTETGKVEKMPAKYEDGYLVFETTHFSYYAVVEEAVNEYNYTFSVQNPSRTEIRNKDGIILHGVVDGTAPNGSYVKWESSNGNFDKSADGSNLKIIAKNKGWTTFTAILCDADGNELARDTVEMYSKSGFFDKIGGFFRGLFGMTKIYEY